MTGLISIVVTIAIVGLVVYLITWLVPMPPQFKAGIYIVAGIFLLLYLLQVLGVATPFRLPR